MIREPEKRASLEPPHRIANERLPRRSISQQNLLYYASLASFYTIQDLRHIQEDQCQLYSLCYSLAALPAAL